MISIKLIHALCEFSYNDTLISLSMQLVLEKWDIFFNKRILAYKGLFLRDVVMETPRHSHTILQIPI